MSYFQRMDAYLNELVKDGPAGCGCAVMRDGKTIYENCFGYANLEEQKKIDSGSVYRQFSTTKVIICTAAMMLWEQGKFLLDDPLYAYFPEWKNTMVAEKTGSDGDAFTLRPAARPIQVRDCFSMAMGLGYGGTDYTHRMMAEVREELRREVGDYSLSQEIKAMGKVPIAFDPGTDWLYGYGHELVAGMIEVTSGMKVSEFLQKNLFDPLGMTSTGYRYFGDIRERMVTPYQLGEDGSRSPVSSPRDALFEENARYEGGGAGLFSTVRDYSVFGQMLACGGSFNGEHIIGRKTIDLMRSNQLNAAQLKRFAGPYVEGYGYGLGVRTRLPQKGTGNTSVGEFGWTGYMGTYIAVDPAEKATVVYMHNSEPNREHPIHHRVRNIAFGAL